MPEPHAMTPRRISIDHRKGRSKGFRRISTGSPPDLLTRACTRSCQDLLEDVTRIPTRSSHKDLYKSMQGFCEEGSFFWEGAGQDHARTPQRVHHDLDKIFLQGMVKDLDQHPRVRAPKRSSQDCQKRICCCWRVSYKILRQGPPKSSPEEFLHENFQHMASARSPCPDLLERTWQASPRSSFDKPCARSCKDLLERISPGSPQDFVPILYPPM